VDTRRRDSQRDEGGRSRRRGSRRGRSWGRASDGSAGPPVRCRRCCSGRTRWSRWRRRRRPARSSWCPASAGSSARSAAHPARGERRGGGPGGDADAGSVRPQRFRNPRWSRNSRRCRCPGPWKSWSHHTVRVRYGVKHRSIRVKIRGEDQGRATRHCAIRLNVAPSGCVDPGGKPTQPDGAGPYPMAQTGRAGETRRQGGSDLAHKRKARPRVGTVPPCMLRRCQATTGRGVLRPTRRRPGPRPRWRRRG
jgi:hypothetical protein